MEKNPLCISLLLNWLFALLFVYEKKSGFSCLDLIENIHYGLYICYNNKDNNFQLFFTHYHDFFFRQWIMALHILWNSSSYIGFFNFNETFNHACMQDFHVREQIVAFFINKIFSHCPTAVI